MVIGNRRAKRSNKLLGYEDRPTNPMDWTPNLEHLKGHPNNSSDHSHLNPLRGQTIDHQAARPLKEIDEDFGTFHAKSAEITEESNVNAFCAGSFTTFRYDPIDPRSNPDQDVA